MYPIASILRLPLPTMALTPICKILSDRRISWRIYARAVTPGALVGGSSEGGGPPSNPLAESPGRFYEGNARRRRTTMSAKRKMTKEETALFQKATEAMRLFPTSP
jgi:hypothetical protein